MKSTYLQLKNKKIKFNTLTSLKDRIKGFRFQLDPITTGLCYPKKKSITTYFLCQNIDIVITDKDFKILFIYQNIRSEKVIFRKKKAYYIFELPAFSSKDLQIGQQLQIITKA